ncbi:hypothetical protein IEQ34_003365 [Dendrobium chrysotoxum]|uniref:Uncharacterized protein n=1 Tax=Dendrobium chrysotoxum TaxID=161865 RepID=A0AAV7HKE3_DENCH|nr:hypothetical protein IEQ34_003365 [Dendrobium chrysotoxum]
MLMGINSIPKLVMRTRNHKIMIVTRTNTTIVGTKVDHYENTLVNVSCLIHM